MCIRDRYNAALAGRRRAAIDIDLGEDERAKAAVLPEEEKPEIGPGGTFGMFPPRRHESLEAGPQAEVQLPPRDDAPFVPDAPVPQAPAAEAQQARQMELADLVKRAVGTADKPAQPVPAPAETAPEDGLSLIHI